METFNYTDTITITFGDCAETHVGMEKIGKLSNIGYTLDDLKKYKKCFEGLNAQCKLYKLNGIRSASNLPDAYFLVIKNGISCMIDNSNELYNEIKNLEWDKYMFSYGKVMNKKARYNLMFDNNYRAPDYKNGKGTIISFDDTPILYDINKKLPIITNDNEKNKDLFTEANHYYDINNTGIGYHGDAERKKTIGLRLGANVPLCFQWYFGGKPVGKRIKFILEHGDMYFMCEKANGNDWKKKSIFTLRHAAGCDKYITIKK